MTVPRLWAMTQRGASGPDALRERMQRYVDPVMDLVIDLAAFLPCSFAGWSIDRRWHRRGSTSSPSEVWGNGGRRYPAPAAAGRPPGASRALQLHRDRTSRPRRGLRIAKLATGAVSPRRCA